MKLLLTSAGLTNESISKALFNLVGKEPEDTTLSFIPTSANIEEGDKGWLIDDLFRIKQQVFKSIDIVDISALEKKMWFPRLENADVLFFSGGNTTHLMYWLEKTELNKLLPDLLKTKVYAGISAGSIVASPSLWLSSDEKKAYYEENFGYKNERALGFVDFHIRPHLNSPHFPEIRENFIKERAEETKDTIYALDDQSAIKVDGDKVKVVSEGEYLVFNK